MLRISTRGRYGLRALVYIAAQERLGKTVTASEISRDEDISEKYLEHLLSFLRASGFIRGKRGVKGGYSLSVPEDKVSLYEILVSLEGPIEPVFCVTDPQECERSDLCVTRSIWVRLNNSIAELLSSITLKDLVDDYLENIRISKQKIKKVTKKC